MMRESCFEVQRADPWVCNGLGLLQLNLCSTELVCSMLYVKALFDDDIIVKASGGNRTPYCFTIAVRLLCKHTGPFS